LFRAPRVGYAAWRVSHSNASPAASLVGPSLRARFAGRFLVGTCVGGVLPASLDATERELLTHQFNVLTPENCMKPGPIHPEPERFDFTASDALVRFAAEHQMPVVGHCLCWHQQSPTWMFDAGIGRHAALEQLRAHIHRVAGRYRGRLLGWDVVNEAIADDGDGLRDTPAAREIGPDFVERAFELAREADPGAELYYNDYNIERPAKRERTLTLLRRLLASGVRIDGVGIQGHWQLGQIPFEDIRAAIDAFASLGLKVMITELDLDVVERPDCSADIAVQRAYTVAEDVYRDGLPAAIASQQAESYARLFQLLCERPGAVTRVSFWGLHDGRSWLNTWPGKRTNHPLLFDRSCRAKPAFDAVLGVAGDVA
jgi:endo-1,4-beta-xylanase